MTDKKEKIEKEYTYDAFISYRRVDGAPFARRLRHRLQDYKLPKNFKDQQRKLKIYLDEIYEHATEDFFKNTIQPALDSSKVLIVIQTPGAAEKLDGDEDNWVAREIKHFMNTGEKRNVWVALAIGNFSDPLPASIEEIIPNVERVDIRSLGGTFPGLNEDDLLKFIGPMHEIPHLQMPELRREAIKRNKRKRLSTAIVTSAIIATISILSIISFQNWKKSQLEATRQKALRIAGDALNVPAGEYDLAFLLAAEAIEQANLPQTLRSLTDLSFKNPMLFKYFHCPIDKASYAVTILESQDKLLLSCENQLRRFDIKHGTLEDSLNIENVRKIFPIPNTELIALGGDQNLRVIQPDWTYETIELGQGTIDDFAYDEDISTLFVIDSQNNVSCWKVENNTIIASMDECATNYFESKFNGWNYMCQGYEPINRYTPVSRYDSPELLRPDINLAAFVNETNEIILRHNEKCIVLHGNTHNVFSLSSANSDSGLYVGSAGMIGRERYGAIIWDLNQSNLFSEQLWSGNGQNGKLAISKDGNILALHTSMDGLWTFNVTDGSSTKISTSDYKFWPKSMVMNQDGSEITISDWQNNIYTIFPITNQVEMIEEGAKSENTYLNLAYDEKDNLRAQTIDGKVHLFSREPKQLISDINAKFREVLKLSNDGEFTVLEANDTISVKEIMGKRHVKIPISILKGDLSNDCRDLIVSSDGKLFRASSSYDRDPIAMLDWSEEAVISYFDIPYTSASGLTYSIDEIKYSTSSNQLYARTSGDRTAIIVWDTESSEIVGHFPISNIIAFEVSPVVNQMIVLTTEGLYLWNTDPVEMAQRAKELSNRQLSEMEINNYD